MNSTTAPHRRHALWTRLLGAYAAVVVCSLALLAIPLHYGLQRDYITRATESFEKALAFEMDALTRAAEQADRATLDLACDRLNESFQGRVSLIDPQGRVLADSMSARCLQRARPECLPAILSQQRRNVQDTMPLDDTVALRIPIRLGSVGPATARLALPIEPVRRQMAHMGRMLAGTAVAALLLVGILSLWLARRIAQPVEEMTRVAERIAAGDFDCRVSTGGTDEIGRLAEAVRSMQQSLRQTLSELRQERNQARAIVAGMSDGVIALSPQLAIIYANEAAARLLALTNLQPGSTFQPPPDLRPIIERALERRQEEAIELGDLRRGDRIIHVAVSPLDQALGDGGGAVLVLCDRTEARRAETMGRELVANASHELRTPLAIMSSTADTLLDLATELSPEPREFLQIIARQAERLRQLVNETLELSQLESGTPPGAKERLSLADLARQVVDNALPLASSRGVTLKPVQAPATDVFVLGFEHLLASALANLVDNALRYTPTGGTVTVTVEQDGPHAVVAVADTGPGIAPAEQTRIFDRFVRGKAATATPTEGSGLGLAIARRSVEIHGGSIRLDSALGQGSTFRLILNEYAGQSA
jgi:signal transduction histidine kinase